MTSPESTTVDIAPTSRDVDKGKAPLLNNTDHEKAKAFVVLEAPKHANGKYKKSIAVLDLIVRIIAAVIAMAAAVVMATSEQILPFFTQFFQFHAEYDALPTFQFFVIAMGFVCGYLVFSLPISIFTIIRPHAIGPRLFLLILDTLAVTLNTAAASGSAAMDYLAHNGNSDTNWLAICNQFTDYCQSTSTAVVLSYLVVLAFVILLGMSGLALKKH